MEIKKVIKNLKNYEVKVAWKKSKEIVCKKCGAKSPYTFVVGSDVYIVCPNCLNIEKMSVEDFQTLLRDETSLKEPDEVKEEGEAKDDKDNV